MLLCIYAHARVSSEDERCNGWRPVKERFKGGRLLLLLLLPVLLLLRLPQRGFRLSEL